MFGRTSAAKRLSAVLKTVLGVFIISLSLLSSSLFIQKAYAADETQFEHPDHIIVNVIAERYPLGPDRRPDKTKDTYSSVIATYRITKKGGEVIKCAYPGQEKQFTALVNPKSSEDSWMFYLFIPKNEPGGIANTFLNVSIEEVPTPGFSYRKVETVDSDGDTRYSIYNTRKAGSFAWTKADRENGQALAGSEWLVEGADGFSLKVVDNGDNDADPTPGSMRVDGLMWGKKKDTGAVWGTYTLTETKAPEGYAFDPNAAAAAKKTVHFDETTDFDKPIDLGAITNARKLGSARWTKVDASDSTLLPGSEWLVEGADGFSLKVVDNGDNDADPEQGAFLVNDLAWGTYTLTETKAPTGYQLADKPTNFDVKSTNLDVKLEPLSNTKTEVPEPPTKNEDKPKKTTPTKEKLPQTSDTSTLVIASVAVIALAFIASGADMRLRSAR